MEATGISSFRMILDQSQKRFSNFVFFLFSYYFILTRCHGSAGIVHQVCLISAWSKKLHSFPVGGEVIHAILNNLVSEQEKQPN